MASASGLSALHRVKARTLAVNAAKLGVRHESAIHYTQDRDRWEGIDEHLKAYRGQYPRYADCSAFVTWCIWNGLSHYGVRDTVNGTNWHSGFTGTMLVHGKPVKHRYNWARADALIYGYGEHQHTALLIDPIRGWVISHGSEGGPMKLKWNYRDDLIAVRRFI